MSIEIDCGDNSCQFATQKGGMRTNGGCRCLYNAGFGKSGLQAVSPMFRRIKDLEQKLASVTKELGEANRKLLCFEKLTPYRLEYGERIVNLEKELDQAKEVIDSTHSVLVEIFNHSMLTVRTKKIIQDVLDVMAKVKELPNER
jgi:hypothetical protein